MILFVSLIIYFLTTLAELNDETRVVFATVSTLIFLYYAKKILRPRAIHFSDLEKEAQKKFKNYNGIKK